MRALPAPPLLFITDRLSAPGDVCDIVGRVLDGGCRWIMVREKDLSSMALAALAEKIVSLARPYEACVVVNGEIDVAQSAGADGVHLRAVGDIALARETMGDNALIGLSCHSREELRAAIAAGADYTIFSPVFMTDSKPGYGPALGVSGLRVACSVTPGPVIALAGVSKDNAAECLLAGASGIAVMGGIMRSADPARTTREILSAIEVP